MNLTRAQPSKFDWSKLALELGVVFVGVLLALAVNEWVTSRHEHAGEEVLLRDVRTEFQAIIKDMDREIVFRNAMTVVYAYEELKPALERVIGLIDTELAD